MKKTTKKSNIGQSVAEITIEDYSDEILKELSDAVETALLSIGEEAVRHAVKNVPVDTGLLKNSLTYALDGQPTSITTYKADKGNATGSYSGTMPPESGNNRSVSVGSNVSYALAVETNARAKHEVGGAHFLKNALANHTDEYEKTLRAALEAAKG